MLFFAHVFTAFSLRIYVSYSGGKDSTVLLHLVRRLYPDTPAVFIDTGLEYPEIREFVKTVDNVLFLYPVKYERKGRKYIRTNFRQVIKENGYPIISKEVSLKIEETRSKPNGYASQSFNSNSEKVKRYGKQYDLSKWKFLIDAPFKISNKCCTVMKKNPAKKYERETGFKPIIGTMACESQARKTAWKIHGCNAFDTKRPSSQPMSFWTEQDVLKYILRYDLQYASVYGDIVQDKEGKYHTTGCQRTGCCFCMFGLHLENEPNRFQKLKYSHPKIYEYCMKPLENGGLGIKEIIDWINEHGNLKNEIKY